MLKMISMVSLGAAIVLAPFSPPSHRIPALAQTGSNDILRRPAHRRRGSHCRARMRRRSNLSRRKGAGRRPSIWTPPADTRSNRELAQPSWIDTGENATLPALQCQKAAWRGHVYTPNATPCTTFVAPGSFPHTPHKFHARRVAIRELHTGSLQGDAQRLDCRA